MLKTPSAFLSKENLLHNLNILQSHAPKSKVIAMIKANAYGHGIVEVTKILKEKVYSFGVARIEEALKLRNAGITAPITIAEGVFTAKDLIVASGQNFHLVFHNQNQITWLKNSKLPNPITAWLKINTGMNRLGFNEEDGKLAYQILENHPDIKKPIGIMSHFAYSDEPSHPLNEKQINNFENFTKNLPVIKSLNNSAAIFGFKNCAYDVIRPGLALYGASPLNNISALSLNLKPVNTPQTSLIAIHNLKAGDTVGYGTRYVCKNNIKIGVAAIGYGDGYSRTTLDGAPILVNDKKCSLAGRVSMDMITIDLTNSPEAKIGDLVTLWGEGLPIEDVVKYTSCSAYDLFCGIQTRVESIWK